MTGKPAIGGSARVSMLGSARAGVREWWAERLSAIALAPLSLWLVIAVVVHSRAGYAACITWLRQPVTSVLMILLLIALFWHLDLGLKVIIDDYVHSAFRLPSLIFARLLCFALALVGIVSTLRIVLGR